MTGGLWRGGEAGAAPPRGPADHHPSLTALKHMQAQQHYNAFLMWHASYSAAAQAEGEAAPEGVHPHVPHFPQMQPAHGLGHSQMAPPCMAASAQRRGGGGLGFAPPDAAATAQFAQQAAAAAAARLPLQPTARPQVSRLGSDSFDTTLRAILHGLNRAEAEAPPPPAPPATL